jgi:hypothetical protein
MTDHLDDDTFFEVFYIQKEKQVRSKRRADIKDDMLDFGPEICASCNYRIECMVQEKPFDWACSSARVRWRRNLV